MNTWLAPDSAELKQNGLHQKYSKEPGPLVVPLKIFQK